MEATVASVTQKTDGGFTRTTTFTDPDGDTATQTVESPGMVPLTRDDRALVRLRSPEGYR